MAKKKHKIKREKYKLGREYKIIFYDHCTTDRKSSVEAVKVKMQLVSWGRCVGVNEEYVVLCFFWENDNSDNNDNVHILRSAIIKSEVL